MALVPNSKKKDVFIENLTGSYGRFKTDDSYRLDFLMTSVPVKSINTLSTASDIFPIEDIDFDALIQRSIDSKRVQKIASEYLERGSGRVIFFPPLLACVVLLDENNAIKDRYEDIDIGHPKGEEPLLITWDHDGFQLELPITDSKSSDRSADFDDKKYHYYEYAASLKLNPARAKLVVLDGQHRLEAIKLLWNSQEKKNTLSNIEIPICVVWSPNATDTNPGSESMRKDFRELFVRVNHEAKTVSGHFITLLKDSSYSAMAIRRLADHWKGITSPDNWNRLHLLEWNEREDNKVDQRSRSFSITTISIISRFLEENLFRENQAAKILELDRVENELSDADAEFSWRDISDTTHSAEIDAIINQQIKKVLVPALDILLRKSRPYQKLENQVANAFSRLQQKIAENNHLFSNLKTNYLGKYIYKEDEFFNAPTVGAYSEFKSWIKIEESDRIFFYQVFQQGLLRTWSSIVFDLRTIGVGTIDATNAVLAGIDCFLYSNGSDYIRPGKRFTNNLLWKNDVINQGSPAAKQNWFHAIKSTFSREDVRLAVHQYLETSISHYPKGEVEQSLLTSGLESSLKLVTSLKNHIEKETEKRFEDYFDESLTRELQLLQISGKKEDKEKFKKIIKEKSDQRLYLATTDMANALGISTQDLLD